MRLRAPVTRGYFFLRLINTASPQNIDQKKISSGTQGNSSLASGAKLDIVKVDKTQMVEISWEPSVIQFDGAPTVPDQNNGNYCNYNCTANYMHQVFFVLEIKSFHGMHVLQQGN